MPLHHGHCSVHVPHSKWPIYKICCLYFYTTFYSHGYLTPRKHYQIKFEVGKVPCIKIPSLSVFCLKT